MRLIKTSKDRDTARIELDTGEIRAEIARLTGDLDSLARRLGVAGGEGARALRAGAAERMDGLTRSGEQAIEDLTRELGRLEKRTRAEIKRHPFEAVLIALGIGALVTFLIRR